MKLSITFKDPDGVYGCANDSIIESVNAIPGLSEEEREELIEVRRGEQLEKLSKWIKYSEYLTVDFDMDAMTATVREVKS